ncbi:EamA family transporter [Candidatus Woesearchaeota archaeon]|nr:EamA family transporter [Candidatus Woesearchaeota archaeon]
MIWFVFALLAALGDSTYFMLAKRFLKGMDMYVLASGTFMMWAAILFIITFFRRIPAIQEGFWTAVLVTGILNIVAIILYYKALKITDLSLAMPLLSFTPVFLILTSFVFLKEFPRHYGLLGIILVMFGSYILNLQSKLKSPLAPIKQLFKDKGVLLVLIVAFLWSITSNFDKMVVVKSDVIFGGAVVALFLGLSFTTIVLVQKKNLAQYRIHYKKFVITGLLNAFVATVANIALTLQIVPYVISVKRTSILFGVLYGGLLFKEKNFRQRLAGSVIMIAGIVLILMF